MHVGNYRIEHAVGGGLFEARHAVLPRRALIKTVPDALGWVKPLRVAVLREACILEALQHAGIPRLYETGRLADGRPWFACEDVDGTPLDEAGHLTLPTLITLIRDLAEVLEHAHRRGVIHAGLRPDRIVLTDRAFPVCIDDWSCARTHDAGAVVPAVAGPRRYEAPELAAGDPIDDRADVFALGMIARERLPAATPALIARLFDQMVAPGRWDRPSITEVRDALAAIPVSIPRPRWTPPLGVTRISDDEITQEDVILVALD
jgi:serine/threonine-protein kinase